MSISKQTQSMALIKCKNNSLHTVFRIAYTAIKANQSQSQDQKLSKTETSKLKRSEFGLNFSVTVKSETRTNLLLITSLTANPINEKKQKSKKVINEKNKKIIRELKY